MYKIYALRNDKKTLVMETTNPLTFELHKLLYLKNKDKMHGDVTHLIYESPLENEVIKIERKHPTC